MSYGINKIIFYEFNSTIHQAIIYAFKVSSEQYTFDERQIGRQNKAAVSK